MSHNVDLNKLTQHQRDRLAFDLANWVDCRVFLSAIYERLGRIATMSNYADTVTNALEAQRYVVKASDAVRREPTGNKRGL